MVVHRELSDLEMLAVGALSPLTGFLGEKDYHSILDTMHLTNGLPWTIPVTLSVDDDGAKRIGGADAVALTAARAASRSRSSTSARSTGATREKEAQSGVRHGRPRAPRRRGAARRRRLRASPASSG